MNVTWSGKYDWLHERRLAWLLLHYYWERNPQTHTTGTIFWPLLFLLLSARRPARSTTEFSFCQCCISKRLGRDISVLAFAFSYTYC